MEGQSQRSSAPRGLGEDAAEAAAGDMDVAEALDASAESAAGADLRPKPEGWEAWSRNQKRLWSKNQRNKKRK